ncbi:MAG: hypothetical protein DRJ44_06405 [Thermoprotei archaeon]|nr:MAG: hypothetical protein DRJ44_06405 [Thermoprotei archaeon]
MVFIYVQHFPHSGIVEVYLEFDEKGRLLIPKKFRDKLGTKRVKLVMREDGVIELHPVYDPLKLKGSVKLPFPVEELEEDGEEYVLKRGQD